jgi:hypothetical protein
MMSYRASTVGDEGTLLGRLTAKLDQSHPIATKMIMTVTLTIRKGESP